MEFNLDQIDREMLKLLTQDAKLSHKDIGKKLNRSASAITERIRRLEEQGIIKNYTAIVDYKKVSNLFITCALVRVNNHAAGALNVFKKNITLFDEVLECFHITGHYDFLIKVVVAHMSSYNDFLVQKLGLIPNIGEIKSLPVIDETKREIIYPINN